MIDYSAAAKTYDNSRNSSDIIIEMMSAKGVFEKGKKVLDFGCGTGNYLRKISEKFGCACFGVEPSAGMRAKAREKNPDLVILEGDHEGVPFGDGFFDYVYMTDVIHHVPDLDCLFGTLRGKIAPNGLVCVVTESWEQIENRWYNRYFPSLARNEKKRYPDTETIVVHAVRNGFVSETVEVKKNPGENKITDEFIRLVEEKNYSMFRILDTGEYEAGLRKLRDSKGKIITADNAGESLIWLKASS